MLELEEGKRLFERRVSELETAAANASLEDDPGVLAARARIAAEFPDVRVHLKTGCFLDHVVNMETGNPLEVPEVFDLIIANPPYVRT